MSSSSIRVSALVNIAAFLALQTAVLLRNYFSEEHDDPRFMIILSRIRIDEELVECTTVQMVSLPVVVKVAAVYTTSPPVVKTLHMELSQLVAVRNASITPPPDVKTIQPDLFQQVAVKLAATPIVPPPEINTLETDLFPPVAVNVTSSLIISPQEVKTNQTELIETAKTPQGIILNRKVRSRL